MHPYKKHVLNAKNEISYEMTKASYLAPKFFTYCVAGSIFGVLKSDGTVYPCEILDKPLGNLKDYNFVCNSILFLFKNDSFTIEFVVDQEDNISFQKEQSRPAPFKDQRF